MQVKNYLIVYGHNVQHGTSCYKEAEIDCNELVKYMPIIKKIHGNLDKIENWGGGRMLERLENGEYVEHVNLYEMYPEFDHKLLDGLTNYLPSDITHIESIEIFSGEKIKII